MAEGCFSNFPADSHGAHDTGVVFINHVYAETEISLSVVEVGVVFMNHIYFIYSAQYHYKRSIPTGFSLQMVNAPSHRKTIIQPVKSYSLLAFSLILWTYQCLFPTGGRAGLEGLLTSMSSPCLGHVSNYWHRSLPRGEIIDIFGWERLGKSNRSHTWRTRPSAHWTSGVEKMAGSEAMEVESIAKKVRLCMFFYFCKTQNFEF